MHKALFFALLAACAINVACLSGHLAGPMKGSGGPFSNRRQTTVITRCSAYESMTRLRMDCRLKSVTDEANPGVGTS